MAKSTLLVTGASGQLGKRVLELLLEKNEGPIIALTRKPESLKELAARGVEVRKGDFDDAASLATAFKGAERLLLISTDAIGKRIQQHENAVKAAEAAGVKHVVYTSLPNAPTSIVSIAPDHAATEKALEASKLDYTVLRNNLYTDLLLGALPGAIDSGKLVNARGSGATAFVTREDCARAAAGALADRSLTGRKIVDVTGPEALTSEELAKITSELTGKKIEHVSVPKEALVAELQKHGFPPPVAELFATFDLAIAQGELKNTTDAVQTLGGRPPQSVKAFLSDHRAALTAPAKPH